jgi:hypothetical protein
MFGNSFPRIFRYSSRVVDSFSTCLWQLFSYHRETSLGELDRLTSLKVEGLNIDIDRTSYTSGRLRMASRRRT